MDLAGETRTLAQLQHTNIIPIYSIHQAGSFQAICMPYFGATTLADVLRDLRGRTSPPESGRELVQILGGRQRVHGVAEGMDCINTAAPQPSSRFESCPSSGSPAWSQGAKTTASLKMLERMPYVQAVLWIAQRLADGLAHAHERGILHRDLKPANILVSDEGQPILLDFNLAADTKLGPSASAAFVGGTLPYTAPEHLEAFQGKRRSVDQRSDLYALGIILYELLTGRHPYPVQRGPLAEVLTRMIADRSGPLPEVRRWNKAVTPAVESIVRRCLEPEPERRYQSAEQLREDLQRHLDNLPLKHAPEPSLRERARKWIRRHPRLTSSTTVGAVAVSLALLLGGLLLMHLSHLAQRDQDRADQLARLEALDAQKKLGGELKTVQFLLSRPDAERQQLDEGLALCRHSLERYGVLETPPWQEGPLVQALAPEDQRRLREDMGELLFLLARATAWQAAAAKHPSHRQEQIVSALQLNDRAAACFTPDEGPRALWLQRAYFTRLAGNEAEAKRLQEKAEQIPLPTPHDRYLLFVFHQLDQGQVREALAYLRETNRSTPNNFSVWLVLGNCHAALGQKAEAAACYDLGISLWPKSHWAYFNRGLLHLEHGAYEIAVADFDQVLKLRPSFKDALFNRALAKIRLERFDEAHADLTNLIERVQKGDKLPTRVFFVRARVRAKLGNKEGERQDFAEGLRREPSDEHDCNARGVARFVSDPKGALADFEQALVFNPLSRRALQNKASVLAEKLGRTAEAIQVLDHLLTLHSDSVIARAGRGVLHARLDQRDKAHQDATDSLARDSQPATLYQVAGIYALTSRTHPDDRREALRLLSAALQKGYGFDMLERDRDLTPLHGEVAFQRWLEAARALQSVGHK